MRIEIPSISQCSIIQVLDVITKENSQSNNQFFWQVNKKIHLILGEEEKPKGFFLKPQDAFFKKAVLDASSL